MKNATESLKRQKMASQEDVKTGHEEKKHKSMKEELQMTKSKVPILRCKYCRLFLFYCFFQL